MHVKFLNRITDLQKLQMIIRVSIRELPFAGWYYTVKMDYDMNVQVRRGNTRMYGIYKKILESYDFCWATGIKKPDGSDEDINSGRIPLNSSAIPGSKWTFHYDTVPGTAEFSIEGLLRYNLDGSEITYKIEHNKENMPQRAIESLIAKEDGGVKPPAEIEGTELLPGGDRLQETIENNAVSKIMEKLRMLFTAEVR